MKTKEEITLEVHKMLRQSRFRYEIVEFLKKQGLEPEKIDSVINEAKTIHAVKAKRQRRIIWISLTLFTFVLFYFLIPNSVYNTFPIIISIFGAALFTLFLIQSIADFESLSELINEGDHKKDKRHTYSALCIIPGFIMVFVFVMNFYSKTRAELTAHGQISTGTIVNGDCISGRRGAKICEVTVKFRTKEGQQVTVSQSVSDSDFSRYYKGMKVQLVYSIKDPSIVELLDNDVSVRTYTGSQQREITPEELFGFLDKDPNTISSELAKIHNGWYYDKKELIWLNEKTNSALKKPSEDLIRYISNKSEALSFAMYFKKSGFDNIGPEDSAVKTFESDKHIVTIEQTFEHNYIWNATTIKRK